MLTLLVFSGREGLEGEQFDRDPGFSSKSARRVDVGRLRERLGGEAVLPNATGTRLQLTVGSESVDLWALQQFCDIDPRSFTSDQLVHLLAFDPRLPPPGAGLAVEHELLRRLQVDAILRLADGFADLLVGEVLECVALHCEFDPRNEALLMITGKALSVDGRREDALELFEEYLRTTHQLGALAPASVTKLHAELLSGEHAPYLNEPERGVPHNPLEAIADGPYVEFGDALERLHDVVAPEGSARPIVVTGASGSGKTRLVAELAKELTDLDIYYFRAPRFAGASLGALIPTLPELLPALARVSLLELDEPSRRAELLAAVWSAIDARSSDRRKLLVFDDTQWLDTYSEEFVHHALATSEFRDDYSVVAIANDRGAVAEIIAEVVRRGGEHLIVSEAAVADFAQLLTLHADFGSSPDLERQAAELARAAGGLMGVGALALGLVEPDTLFEAARYQGSSNPLGSVTALLSPTALLVGQLASVVREEVSSEMIELLAGLEEPAIDAAFDELADSGVVRRSDSDLIRVAHILFESALIGSADRNELAAWNLKCAELFGDTVHLVAEHRFNARSLLPPEEVRQSLIESAVAYSEQGLFREAIHDARRALLTDGSPTSLAGLGAALVGAVSRALDLIGRKAEAQDVRMEFAQSEPPPPSEQILHVLTSSLPEIELVAGQESLIAHLDAIDRSDLREHDRSRLDLVLARQEAILGRPDVARSHIEQASSVELGGDLGFESLLAERLVESAVGSLADRLRLADELSVAARNLSDWHRTEAHSLTMIDHYEGGLVGKALNDRAELDRIRSRSHVRIWQARLFDAMHASNVGELADAARRRAAAREYGSALGIAEADNAFLTGELADLFLWGGLDVLAELITAGVVVEEDSLLAKAAFALADDQLGRHDGAARRAIEIAVEATCNPSPLGYAAVALTVKPLARSADDALKESAMNLLRLREGGLIVVGASAACLGPCGLALAVLADSAEERADHLERAIQLADRLDLVSWQILCRVTRGTAQDLELADRLAGRADLNGRFERLREAAG